MDRTDIHQYVANDLINCSICLEIYKRPKYLPCLHTFCEVCLTSYIVSSANSKRTPTGFKCPICRLDVGAPKSCNDPAQWSAHLPVNHLIMTLMDQRKLQAEQTECQPCKARNTETTATSWCVECNVPICKNCVDYHSSIPTLGSHVIVPLDRTRSQPILISSAHELCEVHAGKKLEMFCRDHDAPCCVTCTMVDHRKCDNVITIQDAAKDCKIHRNTDLTSTLTKLLADIENHLSRKKENLENIQKDVITYQTEIGDFRKAVEVNLNEIQSDLTHNLGKMHSEYESTLQSEMEVIYNKKEVISNALKLLQASFERASDVQYYLEPNKLSKLGRQVGHFLREREEKHTYLKYRVEFGKEIKEMCKIDKMGSVTSSERPENAEKPLKDTTAPNETIEDNLAYDHKTHAACVKEFLIDGHYSDCNITARLWLPTTRSFLLVNNTKTKAISTFAFEGNLMKQTNLNNKPWDATLMEDNSVAVTLPNSLSIIFIDTEELEVKPGSIRTPSKCFGISNFEGNIYVTCDGDIICFEPEGSQLRTIQTGHVQLYHLRITDDGTIYCTDSSNVYKYDMAGHELRRNSLSRSNIAVNTSGTLFIFSPSSSFIRVVSREGSKQKDFFDSIRQVPKAMCFLGDNLRTFCVVSGSISLNYTVKIFHLVDIP